MTNEYRVSLSDAIHAKRSKGRIDRIRRTYRVFEEHENDKVDPEPSAVLPLILGALSGAVVFWALCWIYYGWR